MEVRRCFGGRCRTGRERRRAGSRRHVRLRGEQRAERPGARHRRASVLHGLEGQDRPGPRAAISAVSRRTGGSGCFACLADAVSMPSSRCAAWGSAWAVKARAAPTGDLFPGLGAAFRHPGGLTASATARWPPVVAGGARPRARESGQPSKAQEQARVCPRAAGHAAIEAGAWCMRDALMVAEATGSRGSRALARSSRCVGARCAFAQGGGGMRRARCGCVMVCKGRWGRGRRCSGTAEAAEVAGRRLTRQAFGGE